MRRSAAMAAAMLAVIPAVWDGSSAAAQSLEQAAARPDGPQDEARARRPPPPPTPFPDKGLSSEPSWSSGRLPDGSFGSRERGGAEPRASRARDVAALERELNYPSSPGRHSRLSPVVGARAAEQRAVREALAARSAMATFADAVYKPEHFYLVPEGNRREAEAAARRMFEGYIARYREAGVMVGNAVAWLKTGYPGAVTDKTWIIDLENEQNTWNLHALVEDEDGVRGGRCLPRSLVAYHEIMHVEEIPFGTPKSFEGTPGTELITTLKTIVLADELSKAVTGRPLEAEVDYGVAVQWNGRRAAVGRLANFYRALEARYGGIGKAVVSPESLRFFEAGFE